MTATASHLLLLTLAGAPLLCGQAYFIPGDPKAGMQVFFDKGCARCHAVLGEGGRTARDLARAPAGHLNAAELVAAMWNHAPAMWHRMRQEKVVPPKFSLDEMTNLFAFLYSVRSLDQPGDAERGRRLLAEKKCSTCHSESGSKHGGPDLRIWARARNPVTWIQVMWNHGAAMQSQMAERGIPWPQFQGDEMAHLIAYIRSIATHPHGRSPLKLASAENGRKVYAGKRCDACHPIGGKGATGAPDLGSRALPRTLGQLAAAMWNHGPAMWESMRARGMAPPRFSNQEMADLIAYLFTERYFEAHGDARRGARLFAEKSCGQCHRSAGWRGGQSPMAIATALWNHGPIMFIKMQERHVAWPRFRDGEIADLLDYLGAQP